MKAVRIILSALVILLVPFVLIMTAVRVVMTPLYPQIEYRMPYFPDDPYGFTRQERLTYSRYAIDYLFNNEDIYYLGDLTFPDGTPQYNERELGHMVDVKVLVQQMLRYWGLAILVMIAIGLFAWRAGWLGNFWKALSQGGWLTIGLMFAVLTFVILSFRALFTGFHLLFFEGDSWLFYYSDTLIRLFPMTFWRDGFILVGGLTALGAILLGWFGNKAYLRSPSPRE